MSYSCIGSGLLRTENVSELDETVREHKKTQPWSAAACSLDMYLGLFTQLD